MPEVNFGQSKKKKRFSTIEAHIKWFKCSLNITDFELKSLYFGERTSSDRDVIFANGHWEYYGSYEQRGNFKENANEKEIYT